jgi:hypothetical protein
VTLDTNGKGAVYKNGKLVKSGPLGVANTVARTNLYFGKSVLQDVPSFKGSMSNIAMFNVALTANQVFGIFCNAQPLPSLTSLVFYKTMCISMVFIVTTQSTNARNILQFSKSNEKSSETPLIGITPSYYNSRQNPNNNALFISTPNDGGTYETNNTNTYSMPFNRSNNNMMLNTAYFICLVLNNKTTKLYWGTNANLNTLSIDASNNKTWNWDSNTLFYLGSPWYINDNGIYIKNFRISDYNYDKNTINDLIEESSEYITPIPKNIITTISSMSMWILPESFGTTIPMVYKEYIYGNLFFNADLNGKYYLNSNSNYKSFDEICNALSFSFLLNVKKNPVNNGSYNLFSFAKSANADPAFSLSLYTDPNPKKMGATFFNIYCNTVDTEPYSFNFPESGYKSISNVLVTVSIDFSGNKIYYSLSGGDAKTVSPSRLTACDGSSSVYFGNTITGIGVPVELDGSQFTVRDFTIYNNYLLTGTDISGLNTAYNDYIATIPTETPTLTPSTTTSTPNASAITTLTHSSTTSTPNASAISTPTHTPLLDSSGNLVINPKYTGSPPPDNLNRITQSCNPFGCHVGTTTPSPSKTQAPTKAPRTKKNWWETMIDNLGTDATLSPDKETPSELTDRQCDYMFNKYFNNDNQLNSNALLYYQNYIIANGSPPKGTSSQEYIREMVRSFWENIGYDVYTSKNSYYDPTLPAVCRTVKFTPEMVKSYNILNKDKAFFFTDVSSAQYNWENYGCLQKKPLEYDLSSSDLSFNNMNSTRYTAITEISNITDFAYLIGKTQDQNALLQSQITQNEQMNKSYDTVSTFNHNKYETLAYYNNIIFWSYYVFWALLILVLFLFGSGGAYSLTAKILFAIIFFIYPLVSNFCIHWIKYIYNYLAAFIFNWVFNASDNQAHTHPDIKGAPIPAVEVTPTLPNCVVPTATKTLPAKITISPTNPNL